MTAPRLTVRAALPGDGAAVFQWRNDPLTRAMSWQPEAVTQANHDIWFTNVLGSPRRHMMIAEMTAPAPVNDKRVGVLRFDSTIEPQDFLPVSDNPAALSHQVSINLNPVWRGQGLGQNLLLTGCRAFRGHGHGGWLWAEIRRQNAASIKIFTAAGFACLATDDDVLRFGRAD